MLNDDNTDPVALWEGLEAYNNTAMTRANAVLFDVCRILSIRLDPDVSGSSFVSDFCDCLQRSILFPTDWTGCRLPYASEISGPHSSTQDGGRLWCANGDQVG